MRRWWSLKRWLFSTGTLSTYGESLSDQAFLHLPEAEVEISFSYGRPAFDQFPIDLWRKLLSRHCRFSRYLLDYTYDSMGYQPLREAIADYLSRSRAVKCEPYWNGYLVWVNFGSDCRSVVCDWLTVV